VKGIPPSYEEKNFTPTQKQGQLRLIASSDGRDNSVLIHQDASIYASILNGDDKLDYTLAQKRLGYVHLIRGHLTVNGKQLSGGDAIKLSAETLITFEKAEAAEFLLFDLPL